MLSLVTDAVVTKGFMPYMSFAKVLENEICLKTFVNIPLLHDKDFLCDRREV